MSTVGHYPPEVSEAQWEVLQLGRPQPTWHPGGPGRQPLDRRRVLKGLFSVHQTGCPWRLRPTHIGKAPTISGYCRRWRRPGVWERVMDTLHPGARQSQGRLPAPSACCADSQRSKTATPGVDVGLDGPKKITGRQRPIWVDPLGLSVAVVVTAAHMEERLGLGTRWQRYVASGVPRLRHSWVDGGYEAQWLCDGGRGLQQTHQIALEGVEHTGKGFQVGKHRWKVERPCGWLGHDRRHSRDYEGLTASREAMIQISMMRL